MMELHREREQFERELKTIEDEKERNRKQDNNWKQYFEYFDSLLDGNSTGPFRLKEPEVAAIVKEALHHRDGGVYELLAYCIMPNHVHMVIELGGRNDIPTYRAKPLYRILQSLKRHTARRCNDTLNRSGAFWQDESYDHVIRDENELDRTINYVLNNPVKASLVQSWEEWPWTYLRPDIL